MIIDPSLPRVLRASMMLLRIFATCALRYGPIRAFAITKTLRAARKTGGFHEIRIPGLPRPIRLRGRTSDCDVFEQIFIDGELDFPIDAPVRTIIDGGANIGLATLYLRRRFPQARIVAIELEAENFAVLKHNVGGDAGIACLHAGLWPRAATLKVADPQAAAWAFAAVEGAGDGGANGIPAVTVDGVADQAGFAHIDLLKLDIEGGEHELLESALGWLPRVGCLAIELHDRLKPGCSRRLFESVRGMPYAMRGHGEYTVMTFGAGAVMPT